MRIVFTTSGGFAPIASLNAPLTIEVSSLPQPEQEEFRQLVERTGFFELPAFALRTTARQAARPRPQGADVRSYTITIEDQGRSHTVTLTDPLPSGDLRVLVERLRWHAAAARRSRS